VYTSGNNSVAGEQVSLMKLGVDPFYKKKYTVEQHHAT
jgi:hypothetical protein